MPDYDALDRETLIRLLQRRDAERQLGLVWERDGIEADAAINTDFVALTLDETLSTPLTEAGRQAGRQATAKHLRVPGAT